MHRTSTRQASPLARRAALRSIAALGLLDLIGRRTAAAATLPLAAPLPTDIPPDTVLKIADPPTQIYLEASGRMKELPFKVEWANLWVGPEMLQAFRARAIDVGFIGGIPPLLARSTGLDLRMIASLNRPVTYFVTSSPGSTIRTLADLKGRKVAFSAGQEQGLYVLEVLKLAGLTPDQVTLTNLTNAAFLNALASHQVDWAPMSEPLLTSYVDRFSRDGVTVLRPDLPATSQNLTVVTEALQDPGKAAAIRHYASFWYASWIWEWEHRDAWIDAFYVRNQHVSKADGQRIMAAGGQPWFARDWTRLRQMEREADDLLSAQHVVAKFDTDTLWDSRFESLIAANVPTKYLAS